MIKTHCPSCSRIYLGDTCSCKQGRKHYQFKCKCGNIAQEVYSDNLGEWPLCKSCLELELNGFSPLPLPNLDKKQFDSGKNPAVRPKKEFPFSLTKREFEIAVLYHLSNEEIAHKLNVDVSTVRSHFHRINKKLNIHSRFEIPHVLQLYKKPAEVNETAAKKHKSDPMTVTITITGKVHKMDDILSIFDGDEKE